MKIQTRHFFLVIFKQYLIFKNRFFKLEEKTLWFSQNYFKPHVLKKRDLFPKTRAAKRTTVKTYSIIVVAMASSHLLLRRKNVRQ